MYQVSIEKDVLYYLWDIYYEGDCDVTKSVTEALSSILDTYEMLAYVLYSHDETCVKRAIIEDIEGTLKKQWHNRRLEMAPKTTPQKPLVSDAMRGRKGQKGQ